MRINYLLIVLSLIALPIAGCTGHRKPHGTKLSKAI
jgi:hypothetical protein